jgi:solute carrier family 13 (sodium-dependent dicarboxylate transporter), member 2/3/5
LILFYLEAIFVFVEQAEDSRVNPIYYMLPATMCAMLSFMTPVSSNLTAFVHGTGAATARQMAFTGIIPKIVCLVLIIVFVNSLGDAIFDVHNFPEWAANRTTVSTLH